MRFSERANHLTATDQIVDYSSCQVADSEYASHVNIFPPVALVWSIPEKEGWAWPSQAF